ncbi:AAA family ATPase [Dactylosporangium darangshiense]|uniref:MoxR family ATPase n=1 Tax=Dactylosporangium darangshiense TaxID=579108 RepID=A0ABP8DU65_9ACTN
MSNIDGPQELARRLEDEAGYLADFGLAAAAFLAMRMQRPLFLEGDPGVGKTSFAEAMAVVLGGIPVVRLQCHAGLDASQALYDWNFPRQIMRLRAAGEGDHRDLEPQLWTEEFLIERPVLKALRRPAVLLVDEIDRADDEFEALLLQVLDTFEIDVPELGTLRAERKPFVVLTSNQTREVHDAIKRRCLYHWIAHPDEEREVRILHRHVRDLPEELAREVAVAMRRLREPEKMIKPPGVAEAINLATAVRELGGQRLTPDIAQATVSTVAKHHEDEPAVRDALNQPC